MYLTILSAELPLISYLFQENDDEIFEIYNTILEGKNELSKTIDPLIFDSEKRGYLHKMDVPLIPRMRRIDPYKESIKG